MKKLIIVTILLFTLFIAFFTQPCSASETWQLSRTYESNKIIDSPFLLFASADLNGNGVQELIITNFGQSGDHLEESKQWKNFLLPYQFAIVEWAGNKLAIQFAKQWDMSKTHTDFEAHQYFLAFQSKQMASWQIGKRKVVETIPPYLGIEWLKGKYTLKEQQGPFTAGPLVGSWVFPWLSPSCYQGFQYPMTWPRECIVGIRDFWNNGTPKIVTILEREIIKDRQYKQTLRVRRLEPGFPVEWEMESPKRFVINEPIDMLNQKSTNEILMRVYRTTSWYLFKPNKDNKSYQAESIAAEGPLKGLEQYDLPDIYIRNTRSKNVGEYWGYRKVELSYPNSLNFIYQLRNVTIKPDLSSFVKEDIDFTHHDNFLGVGFFDVKDINGDGLDEIILVEETAGKLKLGDETVQYIDIKDYIHILKWDGQKYQTMWVSPPYTKRGTKFLVEDIKNTGKKQLVVLSPYGTIQIWEKQ